MTSIIHFKCLGCDDELAITPAAGRAVPCSRCQRTVEVLPSDSILQTGTITTCVSCGHDQFYVQKDFNRRFGVLIVGIGIAASLYFFGKGQPLSAMASLALTALVDFLAYFLVGEVTVCYSCHAIYRGFKRNPEHEAFDLKRLEKYGGRTRR